MSSFWHIGNISDIVFTLQYIILLHQGDLLNDHVTFQTAELFISAYLFGCFLASVLIAWIILGNLFTCYGLVRFKPPKNAFGMEKRRRITINYLLRYFFTTPTTTLTTTPNTTSTRQNICLVIRWPIYVSVCLSHHWRFFKMFGIGPSKVSVGLGLESMSHAALPLAYHCL